MWYKNGRKRIKGAYKAGEKDEIWTFWYENGKKNKEGTYTAGKKEGLWTLWYENARKKMEGTYEAGKLISRECWDKRGNEKECREPLN